MENVLNGAVRSQTGKGVNRRLRAGGSVPGVVYGAGDQPVLIAIPLIELQQTLKRLATTPIIRVKYDKAEVNTVLKEIQYDPVSESVLHVDLLRVAMDKALTVPVPIHVVGTAKGIKEGGILEFITRKVQVRCLPGDIPDKIDVDIAELDIGDSLELKDLQVPGGVEIMDDLHHPVVMVVAPTLTITETPAAETAEEAAEAAKGETAPGVKDKEEQDSSKSKGEKSE